MSGQIRSIQCKVQSCKATVLLPSSWANECDSCGTEYNGSGQMLTSRSKWGEETGEHPADLDRFNPDDPYTDFPEEDY